MSKERLCIKTVDNSSGESDIRTSRDVKLMLGDKEISGLISFKLGSPLADGFVRCDEIVTATIEVEVKLGE